MTASALKLIAFFSMVADHLVQIVSSSTFHHSHLFHGKWQFLEGMGRMAFPIFAFFIVEGWKRTSDKRRYFNRMLIWGLFSQIPYTLALSFSNITSLFSKPGLHFFFCGRFPLFCILILLTSVILLKNKYPYPSFLLLIGFILLSPVSIAFQDFELFSSEWNVFITFAFGMAGLYLVDTWKACTDKKGRLKTASYFFIWLLFQLCIRYDYNFMGSLLVVLLYCFPSKKIQTLIISLWGICIYSYMPSAFKVFTFLSALLLLTYNGRRGKMPKYFFYIGYPLHLLVLGILLISAKIPA